MNRIRIKRVLLRLKSYIGVLRRVITGEANVSYSQYGEDILLKNLMSEKFDAIKYRGFWVDIGAHHPERFSNTKLFSDRGWIGINVDASPKSIAIFNKKRKSDINVNVGIGHVRGNMKYFEYAESALNTFSEKFAAQMEAKGIKCIGERMVEVITVEDLLDRYLPRKRHIDFFSIDTEGLDLTVLQSNNWDKYRPDFILIEIHSESGNDTIVNGEVANFLKDKGYVFMAQSYCTTLFGYKR